MCILFKKIGTNVVPSIKDGHTRSKSGYIDTK